MTKSTLTSEYQTLRHALITARHAAQLTQLELAQRMEVPQSFVSKVETGDRRIDLVEFIRMTRALGADPKGILDQILHSGPSEMRLPAEEEPAGLGACDERDAGAGRERARRRCETPVH